MQRGDRPSVSASVALSFFFFLFLIFFFLFFLDPTMKKYFNGTISRCFRFPKNLDFFFSCYVLFLVLIIETSKYL